MSFSIILQIKKPTTMRGLGHQVAVAYMPMSSSALNLSTTGIALSVRPLLLFYQTKAY